MRISRRCYGRSVYGGECTSGAPRSRSHTARMSRSINTASNSGWAVDRDGERCATKYRLAKRLAGAYFRTHRFDESLLLAQASATLARSRHFGVWSGDELEELLS